MAWRWYGAKTVYETVVTPERASGGTSGGRRTQERLIEERVVLVRARSSDEAIRKAEGEAEAYAEGPSHQNRDGAQVQTRYLGACDVFTIAGDAEAGAEVYSSMRIVDARQSTDRVLDMLLGPAEVDAREQRRRAKFEPWEPD